MPPMQIGFLALNENGLRKESHCMYTNHRKIPFYNLFFFMYIPPIRLHQIQSPHRHQQQGKDD